MSKEQEEQDGEERRTRRDIKAFLWILEQYAISFDHLRLLLSREPGQRNGTKPGADGISTSAVDQVLHRWLQDPAWVRYVKGWSDRPGWVSVTGHMTNRLGVQYAQHTLKESMLDHTYSINAVCLDLENRHTEYVWESERAIRQELMSKQQGQTLGKHIPDGRVYIPQPGAVDEAGEPLYMLLCWPSSDSINDRFSRPCRLLALPHFACYGNRATISLDENVAFKAVGKESSFDMLELSTKSAEDPSLLIVGRNSSIGSVPMCRSSQTAFLTFSDPLLESANLRKIHPGSSASSLMRQ